MATIVPAILPVSREDLEDKLSRLVGIANEVQVDIVDGVFAGPPSWPYAAPAPEGTMLGLDGQLPHVGDFTIEMDLMVHEPEETTGTWIAAGATRILAHLESTTYLPRLMTDLRVKYGHEKGFASGLLSFGLAINTDTSSALLEPHLSSVDYVQFMGITDIGKQGQSFSPEVVNRVKMFHRKHPEVPIQVDGGVNLETAPLLLAAGVSRLVVGSALWKALDMKAEYEKFVALTEMHGIYE